MFWPSVQFPVPLLWWPSLYCPQLRSKWTGSHQLIRMGTSLTTMCISSTAARLFPTIRQEPLLMWPTCLPQCPSQWECLPAREWERGNRPIPLMWQRWRQVVNSTHTDKHCCVHLLVQCFFSPRCSMDIISGAWHHLTVPELDSSEFRRVYCPLYHHLQATLHYRVPDRHWRCRPHLRLNTSWGKPHHGEDCPWTGSECVL